LPKELFSERAAPFFSLLLDVVSLLMHARPEEFEVIDPVWTGDLMIVTELWEDGLRIAPLAHYLRW